MNTDTKFYLVETPEKFIQEAVRVKKRMYLEACIQQHRHVSPFLASIDGLLDVEAAATIKRIPRRLITKCQQPYLRTCGYIKSRISITLVRSTHWCIGGSRVL